MITHRLLLENKQHSILWLPFVSCFAVQSTLEKYKGTNLNKLREHKKIESKTKTVTAKIMTHLQQGSRNCQLTFHCYGEGDTLNILSCNMAKEHLPCAYSLKINNIHCYVCQWRSVFCNISGISTTQQSKPYHFSSSRIQRDFGLGCFPASHSKIDTGEMYNNLKNPRQNTSKYYRRQPTLQAYSPYGHLFW